MNTEMADAMMEAMPPVDYEQLATKSDLADVRTELKADIADLRGEFGDLRGEFGGLRGEFAELRGEFAEFRAEVSSDISELRSDFVQLSLTLDAKLERGFATQLRWLVTTQFASVALLGAIVAMVAAVS